MVILTKLLDPNEREIKRHLAVAEAISALEPELQGLDDAGLRARSDALREKAHEGHDLDELLIEAFALCREASRRAVGLRHFDVQLVGGIVLHQGKIAEMKTGEGKTLVASLALYLNALAGKGVHLVTVNDYLARRDAGWMAPIYHLLGLTVGVNVGSTATFLYDPEYVDDTHPYPRLQHLRPASKKEAYAADITYATNSELAFDYLRDNMARDLEQCSQRDLNYGIVDEVDSILIDEARTPHIISGQSDESTDKYYQYARWAARLTEGEDYEVDLKHKSASLTETGIAKMERWTGIKNIYDLENVIEAHQINQALKAKSLFLRDRDYLVKDGEVIIVDEFTGRTMPGRRWSDGLHQAVEAKEGVKVQQEQKTIATITVQNYFRQYEKLAGMTGTALTEAEEFHKIYGLDVVVIPTHKSMVRDDHPDVIYKSEKSKFDAVIDEIVEMNRQKRPVLVGTVSVEKSERLARMLEKRGIKHNVLNAKQHEREAAIVAEAGQPAAVTIATNMAGRGSNILGYVKDIIDKGIDQHCADRHVENWELEDLVKYLSAYLPIDPGSEIPESALRSGREGLSEHLNAAAADAYDRKVEEIGADLMPMVERDVMLRTIDWQWMEYLTQMEHFREGIGLRAYGQRDPLVEYKNEAVEMFNELRDRIQASIVARIFRVQVQRNAPPPPPVVRQVFESGPGEPDGSGANGAPRKPRPGTPAAAVAVPGGAAAKIGRNDPCWCGSGKKYKRCHGR